MLTGVGDVGRLKKEVVVDREEKVEEDEAKAEYDGVGERERRIGPDFLRQ